MNTAAERINTDLEADTALQAVIAGKSYRGLAPKNAKVPFVVYRIKENKRPSKDTGEYEVQIICYQDSLTKASILAGLVKDAFEDNIYRYLGGSEDYADQEGKEAYRELNFNFKI